MMVSFTSILEMFKKKQKLQNSDDQDNKEDDVGLTVEKLVASVENIMKNAFDIYKILQDTNYPISPEWVLNKITNKNKLFNWLFNILNL